MKNRLKTVRSFFYSTALITAALMPSAGIAGPVVIDGDTFGTCAETVAGWNANHGGGYSLSQAQPFQYSYWAGSGFDQFGELARWMIHTLNFNVAYPQGGYQPCTEFREVHYYNKPSGPTIGSPPSSSPPNGTPPFSDHKYLKPLCTVSGLVICEAVAIYASGGAAAAFPGTHTICRSLAVIGCFYLLEKSPDAVVWVGEPLGEIPVAASFSIMVLNAGDGDWVAMAHDDVEFYRQPLSEFVENRWYRVDIPVSILSATEIPRWSAFLESANESNASFLIAPGDVSFTIEPDEPEPVGALLDQLHNDVIGVGPNKLFKRTIAKAQLYYAVPDIQTTCAVMRFFDHEVRLVWRLSQITRRAAPWKITGQQMDELLTRSGVIQIALECN